MQFVSFSVVVLCFALTVALNEANDKDVVIFRGEHDRFTNVSGCAVSNAVCFNESCADCHCLVNQTFIQTRGQYGKCVSNELIVYATSYEDSFLVQNNISMSCIYQKLLSDGTAYVLESSLVHICNEKNQNSRWIWTNFGQLLNWKTIECMTDDIVSSGLNYIRMKKCDKNNRKQLWECVGDKNYDIIQTRSHRYMYYGGYQFVTTKDTQPSDNTTWQRFGSEKDVCSQAAGCEIFADGSSLVILNKTKCKEQSECLGEKEIELNKTRCAIVPNKTQYLHNDTWEELEKKTGSFFISSLAQKISLKWNLAKTPKSWSGLIVKIQFMCENPAGAKTEHCVVIKHTGTFTGFRNGDEGSGDGEGKDGDGKDGDGKDGDDDNDGDSGVDSNNKDKEDKDNNGEDKNNTKVIIIVVVLVIALLLSGAFIVYKYRKRKRNTERQATDVPSCNEEYANATNQLYPANNNISGQRECELYEPTANHVYQYVDADDRTAVLPPQHSTYDYAFVDGPLTKSERSSVELDGTKDTPLKDEGLRHDKEEQTGKTKDRIRSTKPPPHTYHVLEGP